MQCFFLTECQALLIENRRKIYYMKVIIEILLCAVIAAGAIIGAKRGFVTIMAKPVKVIASIALAFVLCKGVASLVVLPIIEAPITNYISEFLYANCSGLTAETISTELPTILKISAAIFNIDINALAREADGEILDAIVERLTLPAIEVISVIIAFVLTLVLLRILLWVMFGLVNLIFKGGIFGVFNRAFGLLFGTAISFVLAWAMAVFLQFIFHIPALESNEVIAGFEGGFFYNFFNTYSPIELLLSF